MGREMACVCALLLVAALLVPFSAGAQSSPQQTLTQYLADLQKNPNDYALREKIIRYVQTMKPAPPVPKEAERFMTRGAVAMKSAKDVNDFKDAVTEFEKSTLVAPWLANAYYNLGIAQDKAGLYDAAIKSLKLYLLAAPNASDANSVEKLIYEIEYRQEKAAKESSPQGIAAKKQKEYEDWLKKIDGRRYTYRESFERITHVLDVKGRLLIEGAIVDPDSPVRGPRGYTEINRYEMRGRVVEGPVINTPAEIKSVQAIFTISEDGEKIHLEKRLGVGKGREYDYYWQR